MTRGDPNAPAPSRQSDMLLWLAAGGVAAVAAAWLLMLQPWRTEAQPPAAPAARAAPAPASGAPMPSEAQPEPAPRPAQADADDGGRVSPATAAARLEARFEDPLTAAQLALEAGLLVEPDETSAWSLFTGVLEREPDNETALAGRARVAELLIARADTALEQGRVDDARGLAERVSGAIEGHAGAAELAARIEAATRPPPPPPEPEPPAPEEPVPAGPPAPDPTEQALADAFASFEEAMRANRLLTPAAASARRFVEVMLELDAADERALAARARLLDELLSRSRQALEALDTTAARTWIDEAARLDTNPAAVERARSELVDTLVAREAARPRPVSSLELVDYVPPEYPGLARRREVEGWIDVEFTVGRDGTTRDVMVVDSSHDLLFHDETIAAIEQWRFEPRVFMERRIDQRVYTRIRFDLD